MHILLFTSIGMFVPLYSSSTSIFGYFSAVCGTVVTIPRMVASFFVNYTFTSFSSVEQIMILPTTLLSVVIVYNLTSSRTFNHVQETQKGEEI